MGLVGAESRTSQIKLASKVRSDAINSSSSDLTENVFNVYIFYL